MMRRGPSDAIHYGNNGFLGAFVRSMCHAALAYSGSRVCIIVSNDAGAPRRVLCNSEQSYRFA